MTVPKVSEAHLPARREEILAGARRAFARHGYEGTTVSLLEQEIGLSRGAIFNYFPDKWALFFELASRDQHELTTLLMEQGLDATIRHLADESPDWMAVYFDVVRLLREAPGGAGGQSAARRRLGDDGGLGDAPQGRGGGGREGGLDPGLERAVAEAARRGGAKPADVRVQISGAVRGHALARSLTG